jgi:hypothetical protein
MSSITMHILGGLVLAAMNSTTLGCLNAVITLTSCLDMKHKHVNHNML